MKQIKIITILGAVSLVFLGINVYAASSADSIAQKYGYPTVTSLRNAPGTDTALEWEQNVTGYNSNDGTYTTYNSTYYATEATTKRLISLLGVGVYVPQSSFNTGGPFTIPTGAAININGRYLNAGSVAEKLRRLQISYAAEVSNYERNLLENENIAQSGNLSVPKSPLEQLKQAYNISGGSSGAGSSGSDTNRTTGDCVGRGCSSGTSVGTSGNGGGSVSVSTYTNSLIQTLNSMIANLKSQLASINGDSGYTGPSISWQAEQSQYVQTTANPTVDLGQAVYTGPSANNSQNINTTQTTQKCTGDIYRDLSAAQACSDLTERNGAELGYNIKCDTAWVNSPAGSYINRLCALNGGKYIHGAELLSGYDPGGTGYVKINPMWSTLPSQ